MNLIVWMGVALIALTGCGSLVPAKTPPQLSHTPGSPLSITDDRIDATWFTLNYPDGWRVVTNIAIEPIRLTLVSPDEAMVIIIAETTDIDFSISTPQAGIHSRWETLRHEGRDLSIYGEIDDAFAAQFDIIFDSIAASIDFP